MVTFSLDGSDLGYRTAQAIVAERIRRAVFSGRLAPGTHLLQAAVAREMRTSTTPVREAMRELAGEGLLDLDAHKGAVVHRWQLGELREVYQLRMLVEPVAIAANVPLVKDEDLDRAERLIAEMESADDTAEWVIHNDAFHALLSGAAPLPVLTSVLKKLRNLSTVYVAASLRDVPERTGPANGEHRAMLEAYRRRDVDAAQAIELKHLQTTLEACEAHAVWNPSSASPDHGGVNG